MSKVDNPGAGDDVEIVALYLVSRAPCHYCGPGKLTGLPGNACENCQNTGLEYHEVPPLLLRQANEEMARIMLTAGPVSDFGEQVEWGDFDANQQETLRRYAAKACDTTIAALNLPARDAANVRKGMAMALYIVGRLKIQAQGLTNDIDLDIAIAADAETGALSCAVAAITAAMDEVKL